MIKDFNLNAMKAISFPSRISDVVTIVVGTTARPGFPPVCLKSHNGYSI